MDDEDWKMMEAMHDATLLLIGVLAELLIRQGIVDRKYLIATLRQLAEQKARSKALPAQMASAVIDRLMVNLEEALTFLPIPPSSAGGPEKP